MKKLTPTLIGFLIFVVVVTFIPFARVPEAKADTTYTLTGTVVSDTAGYPALPGINVNAWRVTGQYWGEDITNASGQYALGLIPGNYHLEAYDWLNQDYVGGGRMSDSTILPWYIFWNDWGAADLFLVSDNTTAHFKMEPGFQVFGDVLDSQSLNPITNWHVDVWVLDGGIWYGPYGIDADGWSSFQNHAVPEGVTVSLDVQAPGYYEKEDIEVLIPTPGVDQNITVELDPIPPAAPATSGGGGGGGLVVAVITTLGGWTDSTLITNPLVIGDTFVGKKAKITLDSAAIASIGGVKVQFFVDGKLKKIDKKEPFDFTFKVKNGTHTLAIKIFDSIGNLLSQIENTYTK